MKFRESLNLNWYLEDLHTDQAVHSYTEIISDKIKTYSPLIFISIPNSI